jgi:hypothetical protein
VVSWPTASRATKVALPGPAVAESSGTPPRTGMTRPPSGSDAVHVASAADHCPTVGGQASAADGWPASTVTALDASGERLPARSVARPRAVCRPLAAKVRGAGSDPGFVPVPGVPSGRSGSPRSTKRTVTVSRKAPPEPSSGERSAATIGRGGATRSTTTGSLADDEGPGTPALVARTR